MGVSTTFERGLMTQRACQHQRGLDLLVGVVSDGNYECRYNKNVPCARGAIKALRALVEVPLDVPSADVEGAVRKTAEFLASGDLAHGDYPTPKGKIGDHWLRAPGFLLGACLV